MPTDSHAPTAYHQLEQTDNATLTIDDQLPSTSTMDHEDMIVRQNQELDESTVKKLDWLLLPFLALLFLFNSLDRANIGNAETADFTKDIGLKPEDLNTAVAIFFVFFVTLQPVGATLGRKIGMTIWVPLCMVIWGVCTALHAGIRSRWQLISLRIIIGTLEAGFYPTTVAYMSMFYTRFEFARRLGMFYGQYAVAGALGGILSYFVFARFPHDSDHTAKKDWKSWQILFLIEGLSTIILAVFGYFWLPDSAATAWFLLPSERQWAEKRIRLDQDQAANDSLASSISLSDSIHSFEETRNLLSSSSERVSSFSRSQLTLDRGLSTIDIVEALLDWKVWYILFINILSALPTAAFAIFLPLVLKPMAPSSPALINLLAAPPNLLGAITLYVFSAWSDRVQKRFIPIISGLVLVAIGLMGMVIFPSSAPALRYVSLCVLLAGTFVPSPLTIAWLSNNIPEPGKRSVVLGINGWGNLAGVLSSLLFAPRFAPGYLAPCMVTLGCVIISLAGYVLFARLIREENAHREAVVFRWSDDEVKKERVAGRGPVETKTRITSVWWTRSVVWGIRKISGNDFSSRELKDYMEGKTRRGDERLTFRYTM